MEFTYRFPVNLEFGRGSVKKIGYIAAEYGKHALLVTGAESAQKTGLLERVLCYLKKSGIQTEVYEGIGPNPLTVMAEDIGLFAREKKCDLVIGLGGGSVLDCAKAAAFLGRNRGNIMDYMFFRKTSDKALPVIAIPTTVGSGSEMNGFAALTDPDNHDKKSFRCTAIIPTCAIVDSECMMTMPKNQLAESGIDILCHCIESYMSNMAQPFTELLSLKGLQLVYDNLQLLCDGCCSPEVWDALSLAGVMGGMAIHGAGVTLAHGMEHPVSGLKNISHGKGMAALLPTVLEATIAGGSGKVREKAAVIARYLGGRDEKDCADRIRKYLSELDMNVTLSDLGVLSEEISWLTASCCKVSVPAMACHPVRFNRYQIEELYKKSL